MEHGTSTAYNKGCKCDECRAGRAAYQRDWRRRNPDSGKVPRDCLRCGKNFMAWPETKRPGKVNRYCSTACGNGSAHGAGLRPTVYLPGHPLAGAKGTILKHRQVLHEAIGGGTHPCHWCAVLLTWAVKTGGQRGSGYAARGEIVVDHVDNNPRNNSLENLVVSCGACNVLRGLIGAWEQKTGRPIEDLHR